MMNFVPFDSPQLSRPADLVTDISTEVVEFVMELADLMGSNQKIAALHAVQVEHPLSHLNLFVYRGTDGSAKAFLNPLVVEASLVRIVHEGCVSLPGCDFSLPRPAHVRVTGIDLDGNDLDITPTTPLETQIMAHETDHGLGRTILTKVRKDIRDKAIRKLTKRIPSAALLNP